MNLNIGIHITFGRHISVRAKRHQDEEDTEEEIKEKEVDASMGLPWQLITFIPSMGIIPMLFYNACHKYQRWKKKKEKKICNFSVEWIFFSFFFYKKTFWLNFNFLYFFKCIIKSIYEYINLSYRIIEKFILFFNFNK